MFGQRRVTNYEKFSGPKPEPRILHQTIEPEEDTLERVRFDMKSSGKNAHLSSTMYLERTFKVQVQLPSMINEKYALALEADHTRKYRAVDFEHNADKMEWIRMPGFVLQNQASDFYFSCNAGTVNSDPRFLQNYTKLYEKDLKQFIRSSGKSFSNHNDRVTRGYSLNTMNQNNRKYINTYMYCNPERNDRRLGPFEKMIDTDNNGLAYYDGQPWDATDDSMALDFSTTIDDSLLPDGPFTRRMRETDNDGNIVDVVLDADAGTYKEMTLQGTAPVNSAEFRDFYQKCWELDDLKARREFEDAARKIWDNGSIVPLAWTDAGKWEAVKNLISMVLNCNILKRALDILI